MARIIVGAYLVRYPLGGMMSNALEYVSGFAKLGHDVWVVERATHPGACFDPSRGQMTDDPAFGCRATDTLLERFGLGGRWCFVDVDGGCHGLRQEILDELFRTADVFVDYGAHGAWAEKAQACGATVLIDGEPGYNQVRMLRAADDGEVLPTYDAYFTNGRNVGTARSDAPSAGIEWQPIFHPVDVDRFPGPPPLPTGGPFTTIMNWQSHATMRWGGRVLHQKDVEFARFVDLPRRVSVPVEVAAAGKRVPHDELRAAGWRVVDAHRVTWTYDRFRSYLDASRGEFGVVKHVFRELRTGWFSDRSAAYLANGRPVVLQETGWSDHLPTGDGLFAVDDVESAAAAIEAIEREPQRHAAAARDVARSYLDPSVVLPAVLRAAGC